jgi:acyl-CoA synthetase (AMP-forming)/AMP-acid ligase II
MNREVAQIRTIPEALGYWAERTPAAIALLSPGQEPVTYRDLHHAVERFAAELRAFGLGRQDAVALWLPEGPGFAWHCWLPFRSASPSLSPTQVPKQSFTVSS